MTAELSCCKCIDKKSHRLFDIAKSMKNTCLKSERETRGTRPIVPSSGNEIQRNCDLDRMNPLFLTGFFQKVCKSLTYLMDDLNQTLAGKSKKAVCRNAEQRMLHLKTECLKLRKSVEDVFRVEIGEDTATNQTDVHFLRRAIYRNL